MGRITYLDGLRGLAAMQVVLMHCVLAFAPATSGGPLGLLWNGDFAVFLFFLMSGFVLTFSFEREPFALAASTLRRTVRLGFPLGAAALLCFLAIASWPELHVTAGRLSGSPWLADMTPGGPFHALADVAGAAMLIGYRDTGLFQQLITLPWPFADSPDPPQWSLHIEFWGSLLLIGLVCCRHVSRVAYAIAIAATALAIGGNALILFLVGNLIAYAVQAPRFEELLATKVARTAAVALLIAGLILAYSNKLPLLWRLDQLPVSGLFVTPYSFFHVGKEVGAILTFAAIFALPGAQAFLRTRAIAWLGAMSFSVYLLHYGILLTLGSLVYIYLSPQGHAVSVIAATGSVIVASLASAIVFERWVDRLAIRMSRRACRSPKRVAAAAGVTIDPEPGRRLAR